jgi:hypothetical protein
LPISIFCYFNAIAIDYYLCDGRVCPSIPHSVSAAVQRRENGISDWETKFASR